MICGKLETDRLNVFPMVSTLCDKNQPKQKKLSELRQFKVLTTHVRLYNVTADIEFFNPGEFDRDPKFLRGSKIVKVYQVDMFQKRKNKEEHNATVFINSMQVKEGMRTMKCPNLTGFSRSNYCLAKI